MANTWFTSDLHIDHENIITFDQRKRFHTIKEMNAAIMDAWNSVVQDADEIYIIGDFILGNSHPDRLINILENLRGKKHLIPGNHDTNNKLNLYSNSGLVVVEPKILNLRIGPGIVLCHFPIAVWQGCHRGSYMLHGHSHGRYKGQGKILDVGIDTRLDFRPYNLEEVHSIMANKTTTNPDNRS